MKLPSSLHRRDDVIPSLDNGARDVANGIHATEQVFIISEPPSMDEIVAAWRGVCEMKWLIIIAQRELVLTSQSNS